MRTVHEPEPARATATTTNDPTPPGKKSIKIKLTNGSSTKTPIVPGDPSQTGPTHDEDGNPVVPSHPNDNIKYIPAHHPITGQPGFMITYPPDIAFTAWESSIPANQLMSLLRRQLHWATKENEGLKDEVSTLEQKRKHEWRQTDTVFEGVMEAELARGSLQGLLDGMEERVRQQMEQDTAAARLREWTGGEPAWRRNGQNLATPGQENGNDEDMRDVDDERHTPTPSPPPTGHSAGGGFDGDQDPYDNYLAGRMAEYEERERLRSLQNTPQKAQAVREADAVGALMGMSSGGGQ